MNKYYYVFTTCEAYNNGKYMPQGFVCDIHPFEKVAYFNEMENYTTTLVSWQEISQEEYNLYKKLEDQ